MPLPAPGKTESKQEFIARFMADEKARREFPDAAQRRAVAERQWSRLEKSMEPDEMVLTIEMLEKRDFDVEERRRLAKEGHAMPDGSFPIVTKEDLRNAIQAFGRAGDKEAAARHIKKRAKMLHAEDMLPEEGMLAMHREMMKSLPLRRIRNAHIKRIALCKRGVNGLQTLYKSEDGDFRIDALHKMDDRGELLNLVYIPEHPDAEGDVADRDVIKAFAHDFLRFHGEGVDIEHEGEVLDPSRAAVVESFLVAKGDERFKDWRDYRGNPVDATGGWATVIKIDDPALRAAYRSGLWNGVSMYGPAAVETIDPEAASQRVLKRLGNKEIDMTKEEMAALLKSFGADLVIAVKGVLKPEEPAKPAESATASAEPRPVFKGDPTSTKDLREFRKSLAAWEIRDKIAKGEMTSAMVDEMISKAEKDDPTDDQLVEAGLLEKGAKPTDRERELARELFDLKKSRNTPVAEGDDDEPAGMVSKSQKEFATSLAETFNARNGAARPAAFSIVPKR